MYGTNIGDTVYEINLEDKICVKNKNDGNKVYYTLVEGARVNSDYFTLFMLDGNTATFNRQEWSWSLGAEDNPFEKADIREPYYWINMYGTLCEDFEDDTGLTDKAIEVGNYCTDRAMMEQRALHERLDRLLWRYSMEHDGDKIDWSGCNYIYVVYFNIVENWFDVSAAYSKFFTPVFYSREIAKSAIEEVIKPFMEEHPEYTW